jgi:hypothetical protein
MELVRDVFVDLGLANARQDWAKCKSNRTN